MEIKLTVIAMYILSSSLRNSSSLKLGNQFIRIEKFKDSLESEGRKEVKRLVIARVAVDETVLKYNGKKCYLFAAID